MTRFYSKALGSPMAEGLQRVRAALLAGGFAIEDEDEVDALLPLTPRGLARPFRILQVRFSPFGDVANDAGRLAGRGGVQFNVTVQQGDAGAEVTAVDPIAFLNAGADHGLKQQSVLASQALQSAFEQM